MKDCRLQKYLSDCGVMSRRAAEKEIEAGNVKVNGVIATIGTKIDPESDVVEYKGKVIFDSKPNGYIYIMLNKPAGVVTTMSDEKGRPCVSELVSELGVRVYPVGRLDMYSEGLLLMTNDGALTEKLTHPRHEIPKIYHVKVKGAVNANQMEKLTSPLTIDGYTIQPVKCKILSISEKETVLSMTLYEGRNRQIRKMCEECGLLIKKLKRIAIGEIKLGDLPSGKWTHLSTSQVKYLKGNQK